MNYIVFDLEFNQDFPSFQDHRTIGTNYTYPFEIIQIGAIKLDDKLNTISMFSRYVKPSIYKEISLTITELTGITTEQLQTEETFPSVYQAFINFIEGTDTIFGVWGMYDLKEIFSNVNYHRLNNKLLPRTFINIQPTVSFALGLPNNKLINLQKAVEAYQIPLTHPFHDALNDAYYTAELFKRINPTSIQQKVYDPLFIAPRIRQPKREVDYDKLIKQFEKMYARTMTEEEQKIITLAYKMGKTNQFIK